MYTIAKNFNSSNKEIPQIVTSPIANHEISKCFNGNLDNSSQKDEKEELHKHCKFSITVEYKDIVDVLGTH